MRSSIRTYLGVLLVVGIATLADCAVGQQRRPIRRITASDLPAVANTTDEATQQTNLTANEAPARKPLKPTSLNITEVFSSSTAKYRPQTLNVTERLAASPTSNRRQRPVTTTEAADKANATQELSTRRPYVPVVRGRGKSLNRTTERPEIEPSASANVERPIVQVSNNSIPDEKAEKNVTAGVPEVRPTDRTFNNIVSSSTAKIVMQENIHTDILRHLTTASYAHYETDYVLDESDAYETESAHRKITVNPYERMHEKNEYAENFTTPSSVLFDESYARVSEGIQQNLDEIADKSEEYSAQNGEHFGSSVDHGDALSEIVPKNDTKVSLHLLNHVNAVANDSATANSRRGALVIDNATHVDFERSFLQTKVLPETTERYLIDDVYSTTKIIPSSDEDKDNNISKETSGKEDDQSLESAEDVTEKVESRLVTTERNREAGAEISNSRQKPIDKEPLTSSSTNVRQSTAATLDEGGQKSTSTKQVIASTTPTPAEPKAEATGTTARGRSRMFSSERYPPYNTNNTVEESVTESRPVTSKPTRSRMESTVTARSRSYSVRTAPSFTLPSRRVTSTTEEASTIRSNLIRQPRPTLRRTSNATSTPTRLGPVGQNTENNEGNDIVATENKATVRGAVKFGNARNPDASDQFPIPPTASAWSLATMKEPGRRHRLNATLTTVAPSGGDSEASGSYSKLTTIYNVLAPTGLSSTTIANRFSLKNNYASKSSATQSSVGDEDQTFTSTQSPNEELTTTDVPQQSTKMPSDMEESVTTQKSEEATTMTSEDAQDEDELRFDGVKTTERPNTDAPARDFTTLDSERSDNVATTTEAYETTRMPKDDVDKMPDDVLEDDIEATTAESANAEGEGDDGSHSEGHPEGHPDIQEHKEADAGTKQNEETAESNQESQPEVQESKQNEEANQESNPESQGEHRATKTHEDGSQKEDGNTKLQGHEDANSNGDEENDYGSPGGSETESPAVEGVKAAGKPVIENKKLAVDSANIPVTEIPTTAGPSSTTPTPSTPTSTTPTTTTTTPTPSSGTTDSDVGEVHTYMRALVGATLQEFCDWKEIFKKAVADLLTEGTGRAVSSDHVILRNIESSQCVGEDIFNASSVVLDPEASIPVELYIVDAAGDYDQQLNDAFPLLWGQSGLEFPLKISKVDVVDESLAHSGGTMSSGPIIAAITISCIGAICLLIAAALLIVMRKRQKKVNYGMRCTPVSLDAYSLDSVSVHGSVRRKGGLRASKRSYGNPAFDDPMSPSNALNFPAIVTMTTDRDAMDEEFSQIPHVTPKSDELPEGAETKNRYSNVIPLPETRVVLSTIGEDSCSDYINANFVRGPKNSPKCYIACQAPLQSTVTDFWRMVWEQQTKVIMMLTDLIENGVEKSGDYLPPSEVLDCHRLFGDYQVTLKKREVRETYVISTLQLKNMESNSWREIVHLWYLDWPIQGVPEEASSIIAFLIEARSYMKNSAGPSVVHCSPGTGRTGTVLACDLCIREFEQTRTVDVPKCVYRLRKDRAGCVQTRDQYAFIYKVLNLYATKLTGGALDSI